MTKIDSSLDVALDFFNLAHQNFILSGRHTQVVDFFYQIADFTFCLKFAGSSVIHHFIPALEHLRIAPRDVCDLTICIWDNVSTQTPKLVLPWNQDSYQVRGEVIGYNSERIYTVLDVHTGALHLFDRQQNLALYWIEDYKKLPWWVQGSPLQLILHWWLSTKEYQLTHVAAVGYPHGSVLIAGKSGAGKSTTTLLCMKAGMKYLGEDYCVLKNDQQPVVYNIYNSAKIDNKTLSWFPELTKHVINVHRKKEDKGLLFHHAFQPEKLLLNSPLKALLILKMDTHVQSWLEPISFIEALGPLSVTTIWQLTHSGKEVLNRLEKISSALPCYRLHLGYDRENIPQLISNLL